VRTARGRSPRPARRSRFTSVLAIGAMVAAGLAVFAPAASAALSPVADSTASTVTADVLPTVQINGVVWSQTIVDNTVYAVGSFTKARPAGTAVGSASEVARSNILSFNLTTGVLNTAFNPTLNQQAYTVVASPDKSRIYVGGMFTQVNGVAKSRIAALNPTTGALITTFNAAADYTVKALVATSTTVYAGGAFVGAKGSARSRLAAFTASTGALTAWAPSVDDTVNAMVLAPDGKIIVGGAFANYGTSPNTAAAYGLARLDPSTGALLPWNATKLVRNAGSAAAILSLKTDGTAIYGTGYVYGAGGNLEGTFSADPATGNINWVEDCHGDTYDNFPSATAVYTVSHAHYCGNIGGFPQSDPWDINMRHALAFTKAATGTAGKDPYGYYNYANTPTPSLINWFPDLQTGTYTGKTQAAWSVTGNSQYIVLGGEFPKVNNVAQQGLVRLAIRTVAPAKIAPSYSGANFVPTIARVTQGTRVSWQANSDRDNKSLTYTVQRNGVTIYTVKADSTYWNRPGMGFIDNSAVSGTAYKYRVTATDSDGNAAVGALVDYTAAAGAAPSPYATQVLADGASSYWPMNEAAGSVLVDNSGFNDADVTGVALTRSVPGAISGDAASTFDGKADTAATRTAVAAPNTFTAQAWLKTTTTAGGKILGFGNSRTGLSGSFDRQLYMDNAGHIVFGVYPGSVATVISPATYNNGAWHQISASLGADGMKLYVDDKLVAQRADVTTGQGYSGYWRIGGDNAGGWPSAPSSNYFAGSIDEVAIYPTVLGQQTIDAQWAASKPTANKPPTAAFTSSVNGQTASFDGSTSSDSDGSVAGYSWNFGDGTPVDTTSGAKPDHAYADAGTYTVSLTVKDNQNATSTAVTHPVTVAPANAAPTASFVAAVVQLTANFDASASKDADGSIVSYAWTFGDGTTGTGKIPAAHTYAAAGSYAVTLKVTDDAGATGTTTQSVVVTAPPANNPPTAAFSLTASGLTANVDASASSDSDGSITGYVWDFGDGTVTTDDAQTKTHTYATGGTHTVKLTVKDNGGASTSLSKSATFTAPPPANVAPVAAFTTAISGLTATLDASTSSDSDGTIATYAWDFGDNKTDMTTSRTDTHTYAAAGAYTVRLTVTDNAGATATVTHQVTVTSAGVTPLVSDTFSRTVTNGLGTADVGGPWTLTSSASNFSTTGTVGMIKLASAGSGPTATLGAVGSADVDLSLNMSLDKASSGSGTYVSVAVRKVGTSEYRTTAKFLAGGSVQLQLLKIVNGASTSLKTVTVAGLTYTAGDTETLQFQVSGSATVTLNAKIFKAGTTEPSAWQATATDSSATLSTTGGVALYPYLSGSSTLGAVVATFDDLKVVAVNP
jgi:PKD repeat protein